MDAFESSLRAMERLLRTVGEDRWARRMGEDLEAWIERGDASRHLSAYGGMGSFSDVMLCEANGHRVSRAQEPWVWELFETLQSVCLHLASRPQETPQAQALLEESGRRDPVLAAFSGGHDGAPGAAALAGEGTRIQGWRCLECGHGEVRPEGIDATIARDVVPGMVCRACVEGTLEAVVDRVLAIEIPDLDPARRRMRAALEAGGLGIPEGRGWMRPCPGCGGEDTAVYRWRLVQGETPRFVPSRDNLPMRG